MTTTTHGTLWNASRRDALIGLVADYLIDIPVGTKGKETASGAEGASKEKKISRTYWDKKNRGAGSSDSAKTNPVEEYTTNEASA